MTSDEKLIQRIEKALTKKGKLKRTAMMGSTVFMLNGKMCASVKNDRAMFRIDKEIQSEALKHKSARVMVMGEMVANGFIFVDNEVLKDKKEFNYWIGLTLAFNPKAKASKKAKKR